MTTIMNAGEMARKALKWIDEQKQTGKDASALIEDAATRFNLSPKDVEFLKRFMRENKD